VKKISAGLGALDGVHRMNAARSAQLEAEIGDDVDQYVRERYGDDVADMLSFLSPHDFAAGTSDAGLVAAKERLAFCARCPASGGLCDDETPRHYPPGKIPVWTNQLDQTTCQKWPEHLLRLRLKSAGVKERLLGSRFENYDPKTVPQRQALDNALAYIDRFNPEAGNGLFIASRTFGVGKTHLAVAALAALFSRRLAKSALFVLASEFLSAARQTFFNSDEGVRAREHLRRAADVDVLVLDDLGAHATNDWVHEQMHVLMDRRWSNHLVTIVTSNAVDSAAVERSIGPRALSRLDAQDEVVAYSIFTSAALITGAHLASSFLMNCAVIAGLVSVAGTAAMSSRNFMAPLSAITLREAWSIVSTTFCGVPAGPRIRLKVYAS
jgi:DNA replication protein DnaC